MQEEVLTMSRTVHGPKHPHTIAALGRPAVSRFFAGSQHDGLTMLEEALGEVLGPEHRDTLPLMHWLAVAWSDAGREEEANRMNEDLLPPN